MFRAYAALLTLGFIWGINFIFSKWATVVISPMQVVFIRCLSGFIPLAFVALRQGVITRAQLRHLPHFAVMSVMATSFYYYGFIAGTHYLPTAIAGLLSGAIPIFTFLAAVLILREERPNAQMALGVAMGFVGIFLSARPWETSGDIPLHGILWVLAGTVSLGLSFVYARKFLSPLNLPPLALATWQIGLAILTLAVVTDFTGITAIAHDTRALLGLVFGLGVAGTGLAFFLYYSTVASLGPVKAAGATYIAPVVAVIVGALIGENITATDLIALGLIIAGVVRLQTARNSAA